MAPSSPPSAAPERPTGGTTSANTTITARTSSPLSDERGRLIWISEARPGRTHDNIAARRDHVLAHLRAAGLQALADLGLRGLDNDVLDPVIVTGLHASHTHKLTPGEKTANRALAA
ncbi:transposase family protein [Streptomyces buecherae]|uniref:transposase family protein n=1 Tax=Streptomyces buecherae TaxID=2763006 RepID=UPI001C2767DD|nr:transposase family protein [Streptomyces buecherae]